MPHSFFTLERQQIKIIELDLAAQTLKQVVADIALRQILRKGRVQGAMGILPLLAGVHGE